MSTRSNIYYKRFSTSDSSYNVQSHLVPCLFSKKGLKSSKCGCGLSTTKILFPLLDGSGPDSADNADNPDRAEIVDNLDSADILDRTDNPDLGQR